MIYIYIYQLILVFNNDYAKYIYIIINHNNKISM